MTVTFQSTCKVFILLSVVWILNIVITSLFFTNVLLKYMTNKIQ